MQLSRFPFKLILVGLLCTLIGDNLPAEAPLGPADTIQINYSIQSVIDERYASVGEGVFISMRSCFVHNLVIELETSELTFTDSTVHMFGKVQDVMNSRNLSNEKYELLVGDFYECDKLDSICTDQAICDSLKSECGKSEIKSALMIIKRRYPITSSPQIDLTIEISPGEQFCVVPVAVQNDSGEELTTLAATTIYELVPSQQ